MSARWWANWLALGRYAPGAALGVFAARVMGEAIGLPGAWAAVALSVALGAAGAWLLARRPPAQTWPAVILLAYVVYPETDLALAGRVAATALITLGVYRFYRMARSPDERSRSGRRVDWLLAAFLGLGFFGLYLRTLAPDVLAADSGELQVVAAQLGVAHPPGFPLFVLVAHLFTRLLPFVSPAYAVNLFSAVTGALTVAVVYLSAVIITGRRLPAIIAAIALGTATTFWSQATTANVRSLTGLFAALIIYALIRFREATERGDAVAADRWLILAALFMGFGLTHHVSLLFLIAIGLIFVILVDRSLWRAPRRWLWPAVAGLAGLLPLLYLPLRATAEVRGASPDLATWPGFWEHVLATGFRGDLFYYLTPADLWQRFLVIGNVLFFQFGTFVLIGMILGLATLIRRDSRLLWLLGGSVAAYALVAATYRAPQTVEYMMPAYIGAALLLAVGVAYLPAALRRFGAPGAAVAALLTALILMSALSQGPANVSAAGANHEATSARDYAATLLDGAPDKSVILAHWHWATPLWYLQEVEGLRPDVEVRFVFPEGEPYETTWERRMRVELAAGRPVITTWVPVSPLPELPVPEPLGEALLYPIEVREALPESFTPTSIQVGSVEVVGYRVEQPQTRLLGPGEEAVITVAWRPVGELPAGATVFLHVVGDGVIYAQDDRPAIAADGITLTQFRVTPGLWLPTGSMIVYVGMAGDGVNDREALSQVSTTSYSAAPSTRNRVSRLVMDSFLNRLVGYDWDHTLAERSRLYLHWQTNAGEYFTQTVDDAAIENLTLAPYRGPWGVPVTKWQFPRGRDGGHYVPFGEGIVWTGETFNGVALEPGEATVSDHEFHSARPINRDYVVSVRLIGLEPDGVHWAWWDLQDSIPAMGAIPTLKWVAGSFVRSSHRVTAAPTATPGQAITGALTLYDAFTNRPLPILDERMTAENPWVPLCQGVIQ